MWVPLASMFTGIVSMLLFVLVVYIVVQARTRREAQRLEFQTRLLERVGSAREFGEFLTTEPGHRFLDALTPESSHPHARMLAAVRAGIILVTIAVGVFVGLETEPFRRDAVVVIGSAGVGLLLAALASYVLARSLGMLDRNPHASGPRDAHRTPQA
jgi:multisubunit Na+/H+ antiporter MnhB subunit